MKILKYIIIVILGLIAVVCLLGLFAPKDFAVEREITINKPNAEVFGYLKLLKNQDNWSVWNKMDPNMKKDFQGNDGTIGAIASWDSQNDDVGKGAQEIKSITEGSRIDMELRFEKPMETSSNAYFITEAKGDNQTHVKWGFTGKMPFPFNAMGLFMNMDNMMGKDLEQGLTNLKGLLEQ